MATLLSRQAHRLALRISSAASVLAFCLFLSACSEDVVSGLDQRDAFNAQVLLERAGIAVAMKTEKGGAFTLTVDPGEYARALELLADAGLPRQKHSNVADLFPGDGFLVTPYEQKARMTYAVEQQLAETLSALDGVASARVHVVPAEENGRGLIKEKARAAALLQYRPGADLPDIDMKSRSVLVSSVRGLSYEDVSVVVSPWSPVGVVAVSEKSAAADQPEVQNPFGSTFASIFQGHNLMVAGSFLLAVGACLILILPQRKES
ncbi:MULTISPECIES: type III secretion system inner membrane ring lipoprotein SctJ [Sinorhizobium]|uniref:type III secretion system inner membrane ring lipoprotein SctJ n=1 Tax=Sinorhizobium TaxID=28105 RepID=UPI000FDC65EB|nr:MULTISPECIES: type III secretion inner membrane ring lipoprotein SctJ [Sinorhizobium]MBO1944225.1 type III secretion inner membrane ring lipoprotein SctJ [Sinorhizobium medicae]MDW9682891.1 EscJ/YscJ/HrcJ family type III secretion inner membrane ring protein [Sinorhizobium meliloti]MDW9694016.1 EscJ/YscJ/HrcJ family type III secretion inner membrane ring protein [Sinorhizobium meliloti]MDW9718884.1 EscJ/YscJ/HrcJ family type III secretion inner membrane ring protein [Sinorhizobium meliloti]